MATEKITSSDKYQPIVERGQDFSKQKNKPQAKHLKKRGFFSLREQLKNTPPEKREHASKGSSGDEQFKQNLLQLMDLSEERLANAEGISGQNKMSKVGKDARREAARMLARIEVSNVITGALNSYEGSLRNLQRTSGLDPAFVSKLARGEHNKQGATVASLVQISMALGKTLTITIE